GVEAGVEGQRVAQPGKAAGREDRGINVGQEGRGYVARLGAAEPARQVDAEIDADGDVGIDRVGEVDGVGVGAALGDGRAGLGEREGLRVVVEDGGGDAGSAQRYRGAGGVGGRR